jgi:hypothetical protein
MRTTPSGERRESTRFTNSNASNADLHFALREKGNGIAPVCALTLPIASKLCCSVQTLLAVKTLLGVRPKQETGASTALGNVGRQHTQHQPVRATTAKKSFVLSRTSTSGRAKTNTAAANAISMIDGAKTGLDKAPRLP